MKKRILSILLCVCMVITLLPTAALAADKRTEALNLCEEQYTTTYTQKIDKLNEEGPSWERTADRAYTCTLDGVQGE